MSDTLSGLQFCKMHSAGNDFVCVDRSTFLGGTFSSDDILLICDRHFGIGCDQLIIFSVFHDSHVELTIYNSDATQAGMCGNGILCISALLFERFGMHSLSISIPYSSTDLSVSNDSNGIVKINIGKPELVNIDSDTLIKIGNLHKVILTEKLYDGMPDIDHFQVSKDHNNSYISIVNRGKILVSTIERGSGPTLSCGSAACASVFYAISENLTNDIVQVITPGIKKTNYRDSLFIEQKSGGDMIIRGTSNYLFSGRMK